MTTNLVTETGRRQHIVRENAYQGTSMPPVALCGAWAKTVGGIGQPDAPPERRCKTCKRLREGGAR